MGVIRVKISVQMIFLNYLISGHEELHFTILLRIQVQLKNQAQLKNQKS